MAVKRALLSWSSGKDSAWSLHVLRQQPDVEVIGLLCTVNEHYDRVAMHAVRRELLEAQADAAGLPLWTIPLPHPCDNEQFEARMTAALDRARVVGVEAIAFGDLFLEDIRRYRERQLAPTGVQPLFPLWGLPTAELAATMLSAGVEAFVTCVDPKQIASELCGMPWNAELVARLPPNADPCGENGEFHTFVCSGPMLQRRLTVKPSLPVLRDGFVFSDLTFV
jgi:uncharacterized protein (TIGR00290 family)